MYVRIFTRTGSPFTHTVHFLTVVLCPGAIYDWSHCI